MMIRFGARSWVWVISVALCFFPSLLCSKKDEDTAHESILVFSSRQEDYQSPHKSYETQLHDIYQSMTDEVGIFKEHSSKMRMNHDFNPFISQTLQPWQPAVGSYYYETLHPYPNNYSFSTSTHFDMGVVAYSIKFSQYCSTQTNRDILRIFDGSNLLLYSLSGFTWPSIVVASSNGFYATFSSDVTINYWGIYMEVYPICKNGHYFNTVYASCTPCHSGTFAVSNSILSVLSCTECPAKFYAASTGMSVCTACMSNSTSVSGSSTCTCASGYRRVFIDINLFFPSYLSYVSYFVHVNVLSYRYRQSASGSSLVCTLCEVNYYSLAGTISHVSLFDRPHKKEKSSYFFLWENRYILSVVSLQHSRTVKYQMYVDA